MGIYERDDSSYWWMTLERPGQRPLRRSTGIPVHGGSLADSALLALDAQRVYAIEKAKLTLGILAPPTKPIISFTAYADWFSTHVLAHRKGGGGAERSLLKQLSIYFGRCASLADIDATMVGEWRTWRKTQKKAPGTVNRELGLLKLILKSAVPLYLDAYPLGTVRRLTESEQEPRILTHDEERRLLATTNDEDTALLILAIDTLLRLSSCVTLKWAQVKAHVIVPLNAKVSLDTVPITSRLRLALDRLDRENEWVFPSYHTGKGLRSAQSKADRMFERQCKLADIPNGRIVNGLTFHCLRHTGASRALQKGHSPRTVMKLGGWKTLAQVVRYTHASDQDVRAAAESIAGKPALRIAGRKR